MGEGETPQDSLEDEIKKAVDEVELTKEEQEQWFYKAKTSDISGKEFGKQYTNFSIPTEDEGFDEIRFEWAKAEGCQSYLKKWVSEKKLTQCVEELQPGKWFHDKRQEWQDVLRDWRRRHSDWKDPRNRPQK